MKLNLLSGWCISGALTALAVSSVHAQTVEFRATINAANETTGSTSPATGTAILLYDVAANTFDLTVTVNNFANTITASHIHEGAPGVAGPVVTGLGAEAVYTRNGTTITATFTNVAHLGTPLTLLQNGAYVNFHSAQWPGGEVRGQLIAQPTHLVANLTGAAESSANPSTAYGAALITYDAGTNKITTRINLYNYTNVLTNSHYHEANPGVAGPVVHGLGGASVYTKTGTSYGAVFADQTYLGDPIKLLTGMAYLNTHSDVRPAGEIRGQVRVVDVNQSTRLVNVSARGWVGTGEQALFSGFVVTGTDPVRVLITARGPSLVPRGVVNALANPMLSVHDASGQEIVANDDHGTAFATAEIAGTGFGLTNASEAGVILVLPPGLYSTIVTGVNGGMGIALTEVYEVGPGGLASLFAMNEPTYAPRRLRAAGLAKANSPVAKRPPLELCGAAPVAVVASRD